MATSSNTSLVSQISDSEKLENTSKYGWGRFTPSCMQRLHGARFLLVCIALCGITQGMLINGLIPVSLSSLERRFSLDSFQSGAFVSAYDVAVLLCLIPCTHFGGSGHKGRWLGAGMLLMALGSFVCALPQFLSKPYAGFRLNATEQELCGADDGANVTKSSESEGFYYALLLAGNFLHGMGATPLYTLGITYLDESVTHETSALYLGIFLGSSLFGPVLGFIGGGAMLRVNGDWLKSNPPPGLTADDQQWYGAWWLGFILGGMMALLSAVLMFGFAKRLPDAPERDAETMTHMKIATNKQQFVTGVKAIFNSTAFLFLCIVDVLESILSTGVVSFFPKIVQSFFNMSPSKASLVTGATIVPAAVIGNLLGGTLTKRLKLQATGMILFAILVDCTSLLFGGCFLLHCPRPDIIGVNHEPNLPPSIYRMSQLQFSLNNSCNNKCSCDGSIYQPVCDVEQNFAYFSPCYAGCTKSSGEEYSNCQCLSKKSESPTPANAADNVVQEGLCSKGCVLMYPFFVMFGLYVCVAFSSSIPIQEAELRSVPFEQRSLAFGIRWMFIRLLGTIPGPLLFGAFVDNACTVWKTDKHNKRLDCPLYNNGSLSLFIVLCGSVLKILVIASLGCGWYFSRKSARITPQDSQEGDQTAVTESDIQYSPASVPHEQEQL